MRYGAAACTSRPQLDRPLGHTRPDNCGSARRATHISIPQQQFTADFPAGDASLNVVRALLAAGADATLPEDGTSIIEIARGQSLISPEVGIHYFSLLAMCALCSCARAHQLSIDDTDLTCTRARNTRMKDEHARISYKSWQIHFISRMCEIITRRYVGTRSRVGALHTVPGERQ